MEARPESRRVPAVLRLLFAVLVVVIAAGGYLYYLSQRNHIRVHEQSELLAIAEIKARGIAAWRRERLDDAEAFCENPLITRAVSDFFKRPRSSRDVEDALAWLVSLKRRDEYTDVVLVDPSGTVRLSVRGELHRLEPEATAAVAQAVRERRVVTSDLHQDSARRVRLSIASPVLWSPNRPAIGVIVLRIDPQRFLYPHIQNWPTRSTTGETLLARRDGDHVLFLNELRHRKNTALILRIPLTRRELPAVQAVMGLEGVMEGVDYRGVAVLAANRPIPESSWFLVAKVDTAEIYASVREHAWLAVILSVLLLAAAGSAVAFLWRRAEARSYRRLYEAELERRALTDQRTRTEQALRDSEARLARAQSMAALGNWEIESPAVDEGDPHGPYYWSDEVYRIFGVAKETFTPTRESFLLCVSPEDRERVLAAVRQAVADGKPYAIEHRIIRPDGSQRYVREHAELVRDASGAVVRMIGTVQDITEYKRLEEQFHQAQKLESVARLAGGVAHDFNNLLMVINGYSDMLLKEVDPQDANHASIMEIRRAGERAASLTRQLLAFSRRQVLQPKVLDLNALIADVEKMLRRLIGENIDLVTRLSPSIGRVMADEGQMHQVLMNLAVNSRDAMPNGGTLLVETSEVNLNETFRELQSDLKPGAYVVLSVSDSGSGMDETTKSRLFEPFFTTKPRGSGTGLGLSTVYGIVKQSGGSISVYSELGKGTTFRIYLPGITPGAAATESPVLEVKDLRGTETILLVEDQPEVRKLAAAVLRKYGYVVLEAATGDEALQRWEHAAEPIHLVITDVVMPGMLSGRDLAGRLDERSPGVKVLFMSGYTDEMIGRQGVLEPGTAYLQKPFTPEALAAKVRQVLEGEPDPD